MRGAVVSEGREHKSSARANRPRREVDVLASSCRFGQEVEDRSVVPDVVLTGGLPQQHILDEERDAVSLFAEPLSYFIEGMRGDVEHGDISKSSGEQPIDQQ